MNSRQVRTIDLTQLSQFLQKTNQWNLECVSFHLPDPYLPPNKKYFTYAMWLQIFLSAFVIHLYLLVVVSHGSFILVKYT